MSASAATYGSYTGTPAEAVDRDVAVVGSGRRELKRPSDSQGASPRLPGLFRRGIPLHGAQHAFGPGKECVERVCPTLDYRDDRLVLDVHDAQPVFESLTQLYIAPIALSIAHEKHGDARLTAARRVVAGQGGHDHVEGRARNVPDLPGSQVLHLQVRVILEPSDEVVRDGMDPGGIGRLRAVDPPRVHETQVSTVTPLKSRVVRRMPVVIPAFPDMKRQRRIEPVEGVVFRGKVPPRQGAQDLPRLRSETVEFLGELIVGTSTAGCRPLRHPAQCVSLFASSQQFSLFG